MFVFVPNVRLLTVPFLYFLFMVFHTLGSFFSSFFENSQCISNLAFDLIFIEFKISLNGYTRAENIRFYRQIYKTLDFKTTYQSFKKVKNLEKHGNKMSMM